MVRSLALLSLVVAQSVTGAPDRVSEAAPDSKDRVRALVEDLRDDEVRGNAGRAYRTLASMHPTPAVAIESGLTSDDWQQRQLCALLLWDIYEGRYVNNAGVRIKGEETGVTVSERLIEVTIDGFRDDDTPWGEDGNLMYPNAERGLWNIVRHAPDAEDQLVAGLESDDAQQRIVCALALALGGWTDAIDGALPVLLPHLEDNDIPKDANWCVYAIYQWGDAALLPLVRARASATDRQQIDLLTLLIQNLQGPALTHEDLLARRRLNTITDLVHDPTQRNASGGQSGWFGMVE